MVGLPSPLRLLMPAAPVTPPVANAEMMMPSFHPTSPPPTALEPTLTAPVAQVWPATHAWFAAGTAVPWIVPKLSPTRPPTSTNWQLPVTAQSGPCCCAGTFAVAVTLPVARESVMVARMC
jgi:hypothetical protein